MASKNWNMRNYMVILFYDLCVAICFWWVCFMECSFLWHTISLYWIKISSMLNNNISDGLALFRLWEYRSLPTWSSETSSNAEYKQRLIKLLALRLAQSDCQVRHATGNADLLIVQSAINIATDTTSAILLVAGDTDILVLLCHHMPANMNNLFFQPEPKQNATKVSRCWSIADLKAKLVPQSCKQLLVGQAALGCDTTSQNYGRGKCQALRLMEANLEQTSAFFNPSSRTDEVVVSGQKKSWWHYEVTKDLRLRTYQVKVGKSINFVKPEILPPKANSAKYHSLRTYSMCKPEWATLN